MINILTKQKISEEDSTGITADLLEENAEKDLVKAMASKHVELEKLAYPQALLALAELHDPIDTFFTDIMVMTEDENLQKNRLAILQQLRRLLTGVADISQLQG